MSLPAQEATPPQQTIKTNGSPQRPEKLFSDDELADFLNFKIKLSEFCPSRKDELAKAVTRGEYSMVLDALRRKVPAAEGAAEAQPWRCYRCSYLNPVAAKECAMCQSPYIEGGGVGAYEPPPPPTYWECPQCTLINESSRETCEECGTSASTSALPMVAGFQTAFDPENVEAKFQSELKREFGAWANPDGGVNFRLWAANAQSVCVSGEFNGWSRNNVLTREDDGCWAGFVKEAQIGQQYRYQVQTNDGKWRWRNDPCGRLLTHDIYLPEGEPLMQRRSIAMLSKPLRNDIIVDRTPVEPTFGWACPPLSRMVIYEVHIKSFTNDGTWAAAQEKLPYLRDLGVNALCILPPTQDAHDDCWGYDPISLFAVHRSFGTTDDLKRFVKAAHEHGIACLVDWVPNHLSEESVVRHFDLPRGSPYFYPDERQCTPFGPRLDIRKAAVRDWLLRSAWMWLSEFGFDGVRMDSTGTLRRVDTAFGTDNQADLVEAWEFMQAFNTMVHTSFPGKVTIAEDLKGSARINDTAGFDSQWDEGFFVHAYRALVSVDDANRDINALVGVIASTYTGANGDRVIYTESHDTMPANRSSRMPEAIEHTEGKFGVMRSLIGAAMLLTACGAPMILMGQELCERKSPNWPVPPEVDYDTQDPARRHVLRKYSELCHLRRNTTGVTTGLCGNGIRISHIHHNLKVFAYHRFLRTGAGDDTMVVVNLSSTQHERYQIGVPRSGHWFVRFHTGTATDGVQHDAFPVKEGELSSFSTIATPYDDFPFAIALPLSPYCAIILSQQPST